MSMNGTVDYTALDNEQLIKLDPGTRANVQFKPSKKMKKRRQLDALVGNGKKLPRRKQSGHELLRSNDSESSEVEEFSVLDSQKFGKRLSGQSCCSTCCTLACVLVVASCLLACAALVWMHLELKRDFNNLRDRMELVENKNAGTPEEFQALQTKLMSVNKSVTDLKTGKYGLEVLNKSILEMQKQIKSLAATASELEQSIQPTDDGDKHKILTNTVAELGGDLGATRTDVNALKTAQAASTTQLQDLTTRVSKLEKPSGGREGGMTTSTFPAHIQELLTEMNTTLLQKIGKTTQDLSTLQTQMDVVEKFTQRLQEQVKNISQQMVNVTHGQAFKQPSTKMAEDEGTNTERPTLLAELQDQVEHLQELVEKMQTDANNLSTAAGDGSSVTSSNIEMLKQDHSDFLAFKAEVYQDITSLNGSVASVNQSFVTLNGDVGVLFDKMNLTMVELSNVTSVVEGLTNILQAQKDAAAAEKSQDHPEDTGLKDEESAAGGDKAEQAIDSQDHQEDAGLKDEEGTAGGDKAEQAKDSQEPTSGPVSESTTPGPTKNTPVSQPKSESSTPAPIA